MSLLLLLVLLGLVLIDDDLLGLNLTQNLAFNLSTCHYGRADLGCITITNEQNLELTLSWRLQRKGTQP